MLNEQLLIEAVVEVQSALLPEQSATVKVEVSAWHFQEHTSGIVVVEYLIWVSAIQEHFREPTLGMCVLSAKSRIAEVNAAANEVPNG